MTAAASVQHYWNDPDGDGHNCVDCDSTSIWRCDEAAHLPPPTMAVPDSMKKIVARRVVRKGAPRSVYVGRPTFLGNPFVIGRDGDRAEVLAKYAAWFAEHVSHPKNAERVRAYCQDYDLACWCAPLPCHAEVIAEWLDAVVVEWQDEGCPRD